MFANNVATNHDQQALEHQMNTAIDQAVMANRYDIAKYVSDVAPHRRLKPPMIHCGCSGLTPVRKRWPMHKPN